VADRSAEEFLRNSISSVFPEDGIVGEEFGAAPGTSPYRWILDPIDGTKAFIAGVPFFGTMVAVATQGRGVIGVIAFPALGVSIDATTGGGTWETTSSGQRRRCRVSSTKSLSDGLVVTTDWEGFAERNLERLPVDLARAAWYMRTWGDCYGYYLVATGRALAMIDPRLNEWDAAALQPIMEESGGSFTDWQGRPRIDSGEGIGTNQHVLSEVLELIQAHAPT
jgi:histidinol phosphatase-like enzyme (inositol monophosphatase family)